MKTPCYEICQIDRSYKGKGPECGWDVCPCHQEDTTSMEELLNSWKNWKVSRKCICAVPEKVEGRVTVWMHDGDCPLSNSYLQTDIGLFLDSLTNLK